MANREIPGEEEWAWHAYDMDAQYAYERLYGKSIVDVVALYSDNQYQASMDDYLFTPKAAFQYYIFAFAEYLKAPGAKDMSDAASVFLNVLLAREEAEPGTVAAIYPELADAIDFVVSHQAWYDADIDIYGDFRDHALRLRTLCSA